MSVTPQTTSNYIKNSRIAREGMTLNDDYNYTKVIGRIIHLLENNGFQVDMDPARNILLKLVKCLEGTRGPSNDKSNNSVSPAR